MSLHLSVHLSACLPPTVQNLYSAEVDKSVEIYVDVI